MLWPRWSIAVHFMHTTLDEYIRSVSSFCASLNSESGIITSINTLITSSTSISRARRAAIPETRRDLGAVQHTLHIGKEWRNWSTSYRSETSRNQHYLLSSLYMQGHSYESETDRQSDKQIFLFIKQGWILSELIKG